MKSVKHHLKKVINQQTLTFEEMSTLLYRIAACLNSCPIALMNDNIEDFKYLTPGHFLGKQEIPLACVPEKDLSDENE